MLLSFYYLHYESIKMGALYMIPKPLHQAHGIIKQLNSFECQIRVEEHALVIHDPQKKLTKELREQVKQHKLSILALLMHSALLRLVQVLDMSQPDIPVGVREEYAAALLSALRMVGDPWDDDDSDLDLWSDANL